MDKEKLVAALRVSVAEFERLYSPDSKETLDISGADLSGCALRGVQLRGSTLREVSFEGSDLTGANLTHSDLRGANFRNARVVDINLHRTQLDGADFRGAVLGGFDADSLMCLNSCMFKGVKWGKEQIEYFLSALNRNEEWEVRYEVVRRGQ